MSPRIANWKPPLPTVEELSTAPITMSGIAIRYLIERVFPGEQTPRALCVGQAPKFDSEPLPEEKYDEFKKRISWAQEQCAICPEKYKCASNAELDPDPAGVHAGVILTPSGQTSIRKAAA